METVKREIALYDTDLYELSYPWGITTKRVCELPLQLVEDYERAKDTFEELRNKIGEYYNA